MIIVMKKGATEKDIAHVAKRITEMGLKPHISKGVERTVIGAIGDERLLKEDQIKAAIQYAATAVQEEEIILQCFNSNISLRKPCS